LTPPVSPQPEVQGNASFSGKLKEGPAQGFVSEADPTTDTATWVGQALSGGRYQITAKLGEGGMGLVYRALDRHLDTEVVIKVSRRAMLDDPAFAGRFAREIRSLVQLVHPHIVKVMDVGEHDGLPFAVMQYLPGGSLRDRQRKGPGGEPRPPSPGDGRTWLEPVADALHFIHRKGSIHRDVKPDNILFDAEGHAYLSDFGVAKVLAQRGGRKKNTALTGAGIILGTPHFMAPELIMRQPYDGRADQYALGVTVYELLAGRYPFDGATPVAIYLQTHDRGTRPPGERPARRPQGPGFGGAEGSRQGAGGALPRLRLLRPCGAGGV
jgi:serine/threonine-protein kinase